MCEWTEEERKGPHEEEMGNEGCQDFKCRWAQTLSKESVISPGPPVFEDTGFLCYVMGFLLLTFAF